MPSVKSVVSKAKGKLVLGKSRPNGKSPLTGKAVPPSKHLPPKKAVAVVKDDDTFVAEYQVVKECATCDCFELDEDSGDAGFFHRKAEPQRVYLKHATLRATRVKITVEILETE